MTKDEILEIIQEKTVKRYLKNSDFEDLFYFVDEEELEGIKDLLGELDIELVSEIPKEIIENSDSDYGETNKEDLELDDFNYEDIVNHEIKESNEDLCNRIQHGDKQAEELLKIKNIGLVKWCVKPFLHYPGNKLTFDDLEQAGYIGLLKAAKGHNPEKARFSTYAVTCIKNSIKDEIYNTGTVVKLSENDYRKIVKFTTKDTYLLNDFPNKGERKREVIRQIKENELKNKKTDKKERQKYIEGNMDRFVDEYDELMEKYEKLLSINYLDKPIGEDGETTLLNTIEDERTYSIETEIEKNEFDAEEIDKIFENLDERDREVLKLRFGLGDGNQKTLEEVGNELNISPKVVRQIEAAALRKLRDPSKLKKLEEYKET